MQKRWAAAIQRMKRIGGLAVDLSGRGKFLANNAMAAGTFGAGVAPTTATTAVWLKRWAMHAVWRGGHNALPNLLFSAQYLPWRADPVGHLAVRAWFFIGETIATGTWESADLVLTWKGSQWGPRAAARQSLELCGIKGSIKRRP